VAERVGRELVQVALAAASGRRDGSATTPEASPQVEPQPTDAVSLVAAPAQAVTPPAPRKWPLALVPWLGGLTLAVLYLLGKTLL